MAEGEGGGGECWCGHELFNTVTTEWVQDHMDDPEVHFLYCGNRRVGGGTVMF